MFWYQQKKISRQKPSGKNFLINCTSYSLHLSSWYVLTFIICKEVFLSHMAFRSVIKIVPLPLMKMESNPMNIFLNPGLSDTVISEHKRRKRWAWQFVILLLIPPAWSRRQPPFLHSHQWLLHKPDSHLQAHGECSGPSEVQEMVSIPDPLYTLSCLFLQKSCGHLSACKPTVFSNDHLLQ